MGKFSSVGAGHASASVAYDTGTGAEAEAVGKYSFSLAGSPNSPLANELADIGHVVPFTSAAPAGDALIIDGASANIDGATMQRVLDGGSLVGVANPTAALLASIQKLAGAAPGGNPMLVALKKRAKGKGYDFTCVSSPEKAVQQFMAKAGSAPVAVNPPAQGSALAAALQSALGATSAGLLGDSSLNFTLPQGAYGGMISAYHPSSCGFGSFPCDKAAQGATQTVNCSYYVDIYVYWVNGYPNTPPYYLVIHRLHGSASAGTVLVSGNPNSQGFCNVFVKIKPNLITDALGNSLPGSAVLDSSPQTTVAGSATTTISQMFDVIGTTTGGPNNEVTVTASMNDVVNYPGWGVQNSSSGLTTTWLFYQSDGVSFLSQATNDWVSSLYGDNDSLLGFPAMSFGAAPFDAVTVWRVTDNSFNGLLQGCVPAAFSAGFYGEVDQYAVQNHNQAGCTAKANHAALGIQTVPYWWNLDLDGIAERQNLPTTNS